MAPRLKLPLSLCLVALVVVGSRGHTGLRRFIEGSVSHYVVDHAPCPVEIVHCKETKEEEGG